MRRLLGNYGADVLLLAGAFALLHGLALVWLPLAWIAGGLLAFAGSFYLARMEKSRP